MVGKEKPNRLKAWHMVALAAIALSIVVFAASLGILIGLPAMVEKNIREVSELQHCTPPSPTCRRPC